MLFVTHFRKLADYIATFPVAKRVTLVNDPTKGREVLEGLSRHRYSGIATMVKVGFDAELVETAKQMLLTVQARRWVSNNWSGTD